MIPKIIHYCWLGNNPRSELNKKCLDSWHKVLPEYQIKAWDETNSPLNNTYCRAAYAQRLWSRLSNYVRLYALYTEGGIYLDTDVEVLKNFEPLLHHKCFVGFQQEEEQVDWVNNAVIAAQRGHPFIKRCLDLTQEIFIETGEFYRSPTVTTNILKEMGLREYGLQDIEEVTIYPIEYFYPYPYFGQFSSECIKESTYCIHHWEATWVKKPRKNLLLSRIMRKLYGFIPQLK